MQYQYYVYCTKQIVDKLYFAVRTDGKSGIQQRKKFFWIRQLTFPVFLYNGTIFRLQIHDQRTQWEGMNL